MEMECGQKGYINSDNLWWTRKIDYVKTIIEETCDNVQLKDTEFELFKFENYLSCCPNLKTIWNFNGELQKCTTVYNSVQQCTIVYNSVQQCTTVYNSVQQCTIVYKSVQECTGVYMGVQGSNF